MRIADMNAEELRGLNSATQYPSIPTYHALGERGRLTEIRNVVFDGEPVDVTEKIDGTNARTIIPPAGDGAPLIGSRNELLAYLDDVLFNPAQGIVEVLAELGQEVRHRAVRSEYTVLFGEVFGGKVSSGSKNYSTTGTTGFRLFDVAHVPASILNHPVAQIAAWRDAGRQNFVDVDERDEFADKILVSTVPYLPGVDAPPEGVADTHEWLKTLLPHSLAQLDQSAKGRPEGVVVRTHDRSRIAKIRFEDYERTAKVARR